MQLSLLEPIPDTPNTSKPAGHHLTREDLRQYLPGPAIEYIMQWFEKNPVRLRISPSRSSKFGDYRSPKPGAPAVISVNNNLNAYDFLLTLVHEMAHDAVLTSIQADRGTIFFRRKKDRPKPHGPEWKNKYHELMVPLMSTEVFPGEILEPLKEYFQNGSFSARAHQKLAVVLKKYDKPDGKEFLQDLPPDTVFYLPGGRAFRKQEQVRKRFRCQSLNNRRIYLFSPLAAVSRNKE